MLRRLLPLIGLGRPGLSSASALCNVAESWLAQGVREDGSNRGDDVSWIIHDGGGNPDKAPPWCAYFVTSCCKAIERVGLPVRYVKTGRAVAHWQLSEEDQRVDPRDVFARDPRGLVFVRTRLSRPLTDTERAIRGQRVQGHTGIVIGVEGDALRCVSGNSQGDRGHDAGSGAVCVETLRPSSPQWARLVGFVRVCPP